jgi:hypothetical protein
MIEDRKRKAEKARQYVADLEAKRQEALRYALRNALQKEVARKGRLWDPGSLSHFCRGAISDQTNIVTIGFGLAKSALLGRERQVWVPIDAFRTAGVSIYWDCFSGQTIVEKGKLFLWIPYSQVWTVAQGKDTQIPVISLGGRMFAPVKEFAESLGGTVTWDESNKRYRVWFARDP